MPRQQQHPQQQPILVMRVAVLLLLAAIQFVLVSATELDWIEIGATPAWATVVPLRASNAVAAVGNDIAKIYQLSSLVQHTAERRGGLFTTQHFDLPCTICGPNRVAVSLFGRFLIVVPATGTATSGCSSEQAQSVLCMDTFQPRAGWTRIATLPTALQNSGNISIVARDEHDLSNIDFVSSAGFFSLYSDATNPSYDGTTNICANVSYVLAMWKWSRFNGGGGDENVVPLCPDSPISATNFPPLQLSVAAGAQTYYGAQVMRQKDAAVLVFVNVSTSSCMTVSSPVELWGHSFTKLISPYFASMQYRENGGNGNAIWEGKVFAPGANPLGNYFTLKMRFPVSVATQSPVPFLTLAMPGLILAVGTQYNTAVCSSTNYGLLFASFIPSPRYPNATDLSFKNYKEWRPLHSKPADLLQMNVTLAPHPLATDLFASSNGAECSVKSSTTIVSSSTTTPFSASLIITYDRDEPIPRALMPCSAGGFCSWVGATAAAPLCLPMSSTSEACFEQGCCFSADGVCTAPNTGSQYDTKSTGEVTPLLLAFLPDSQLHPLASYTHTRSEEISESKGSSTPSGASETVNGTDTIEETDSEDTRTITHQASDTHVKESHTQYTAASASPTFTETPRLTISRDSETHELSNTTRLTRSVSLIPKPPVDVPVANVLIYIGVTAGIIALVVISTIVYIKGGCARCGCPGYATREKAAQQYRNADEINLLTGRLNDGADGAEGTLSYGTIGNDSHTVEAVVQIEGADFAILKVAGRGAFGTVFQGKRLSDGALVAIKQVPLFTRNEVEDAAKELEVLLSVPYHKHCLQVLVAGIRHGDAGSAGELPTVDRYAKARGAHPNAHHGSPLASMVLVTPFYKSGDLRGFVNSFKRANRSVPPLACISFAAQLCDVLDFLHKHKIVHRDVKPENVLLSDDYKSIVLTDFGLAKLTYADNETLVTKAGSLPYVAPECFHGNYHASVDNWSVGSVMFAIVTKRVDADNACVMYMEAMREGFELMIRRELASMPLTYIDVVLGFLKDDPRQRLGLREARRMLIQCVREQQGSVAGSQLDTASVRTSSQLHAT